MRAEWGMHLVALYGVLALSLLLSLYLWVSAKIEMRAQASRTGATMREMMSALDGARAEAAELRLALTALDDAVRDLRETSGALVAPQPARSGLNLSSRSQVLRRHRYGESPADIAASLGLPRAEVGLLLKVSRIVVDGL